MVLVHPVLEQQLRELGLDRGTPPDAARWGELLDRVSAAYDNLAGASAAATAVQTAVLEASHDGVLVVDRQHRVVMCNRRFLELWKLPPLTADRRDGELLGAVLAQLANAEGYRGVIEQMVGRDWASSEDELQLMDGREIEAHTHPALDAEGALRGRLWVFRDVTARRADERKLREAHAFLDSIVETIPNMVFVKDAVNLRFVRFNRAGEQLLGLPRSELIGKNDHDMFPPHQADFFVTKDREVLAQRGVITIEEEMIETAHGGRRLRTRKTPISDAEGRPRYLLGVCEDITEERSREAELYLAKERAETASRAKSDFLLNMSHELRTPLNSILGFARVLHRSARERLSAEQLEHLADIVQAGDHMLQLINDLLDLRSLEALPLELGPVELLPPLAEAMKMVQPLLHERAQTFAFEAESDLPPAVGARRAIVQVLINLLTNATKFTPERGHVAVHATRDGHIVRLRVSDTGVGIAPEDQAKLFVYFEQLRGKHQHHMKGSGVGLALTRALVEKMGGSISVSSKLGEGTTFEVELRAAG